MWKNKPNNKKITEENAITSHGYIMIAVLLLLSLAMIIVTQIYRNGRIQTQFDKIFIQREKAKLLALNGLALAYSQLYVSQQFETNAAEKKASDDQKKDTPDPIITFLENVLPYLNQSRTIKLKKEFDNIEGTIDVCISCEEGKIPINLIYNFENKKFINAETEQFIKTLFSNLKQFVSDKDLFNLFEKFLKERQYKVNDPTELLTIQEFQEAFRGNIFYEPTHITMKKKKSIYLMDIFTVWSNKAYINPWFISNSLAALLQFKQSHELPINDRKKVISEILKTFKKSTNLKETWNTSLKKVYGKDFQSLPKGLTQILREIIPPRFFSIVSSGTFGDTTQKLYAIIEKHESKNEIATLFSVKRLYWI